MAKGSKCIIVVRIRGRVGVSRGVEDTLRLLHLTRVNHATILLSSPPNHGMLQKVKDCVTWGEADAETLGLLLGRRGEFVGGTRLCDEVLAESSEFKSVKDLANVLCAGSATIKDIQGLKPVFRLHPPRGGFHGSRKRAFVAGGELGYRGEAIADLVSSML